MRTGATDTGDAERPALPATSWAVLGLLSFGEELSGYDLKKWSDWSLRLFYWSPSFSQIYGELKRLEKVGYLTSRMVAQETGNRDKRVYVITDAGMAAVRHWAREAPVEPPVLKHGVMLRMWLGHLLETDRMREVLGRHREYAETMRQRAEVDVEDACGEEAWAYPALVLKWSERYYASERDLADAMLADLDERDRRRL
ncbi:MULTISPECIES: PadR family transcriptional regulator [Streptomyces]|nr:MULTISPECIES: PadR family transcriptional regulator [Streptomyces]MCW7985837.1 PadR family transcriptional regulator [Streptomyces platensis subsp. clarensis]AWN31907.1 PadR family transcriptional regulator [Streptomyces sp. NEAU-S7GS2]MCX5445333.1 PadR family transcriptional regulator [Streptomyces libani]MYT14723.1 PadR family transcriptional regulator [Streptomyces sp. SID4951]WAU02006.1 PadR family transcriptional regulator [Streptomyces libani subsp. libani]